MNKFAPAIVMLALFAVGLIAAREWVTGGGSMHVAAAETSAPVTAAPEPKLTGRTAVLRKEADGHYWATAYVNDTPMRFLVDTGASVIALTEKDARKAGLDPAKLPHIADISTANGHVKAGVAKLDSVRIANVELTNVQAVVLEDGLDNSLLGMSFLNRLKGWQVTPTSLVLKQ